MQTNIVKILQKYKEEQYFFSISSGLEIDGHKNFLFINRLGNLRIPGTIVRACHGIADRYNKEENRKGVFLPSFTPHGLRHTACTRMAEGGMDIKSITRNNET